MHSCEVTIDGISIEAVFTLNDTFTRNQSVVRTKSGKEFQVKESTKVINEQWSAALAG
jgi:hypothetical protein